MSDKPLARGVYALSFLSSCGHTILVAIDDDGRLVARALVFEGESEGDVATMLEGVLDGTLAPPATDTPPTFTIKACGVKNAISKLIASTQK